MNWMNLMNSINLQKLINVMNWMNLLSLYCLLFHCWNDQLNRLILRNKNCFQEYRLFKCSPSSKIWIIWAVIIHIWRYNSTWLRLSLKIYQWLMTTDTVSPSSLISYWSCCAGTLTKINWFQYKATYFQVFIISQLFVF